MYLLLVITPSSSRTYLLLRYLEIDRSSEPSDLGADPKLSGVNCD
jgi:hypothetical protein